MKKIYTLAKVLILSAIFYSEANAQSCPGIASPTRYQAQNSCYVVINGSTPDANVNLFNAANQRINTAASDQAKTDATGSSPAVFFDCNSSVAYITLTTPLNGGCFLTNITAEAALPIKLKSFNASIKSESSVQLNWTSAQEANSLQYVVEKSADGKNFSGIGTVAAAGYSNRDISYGFNDKQFSSTAFYRLRMVDIDGHAELSKVVYVNNGKGGTTTLSVFPNPFKSDIQLKGVSSSEINSQNVKVFNVAGKQVGYRIIGSNSIAIDANLPQGIYILRVKDQNYKLIKE